jgi:hypothetical protein
MEAGASVSAEAVGGYFERAVILTGFEGDDLSVRRPAVLCLELAVDQAVRRAEFTATAGLGDDRELDLGAVAEVVRGDA